MRYVILTALVALFFAGAARAEQPKLDYILSGGTRVMGDTVASDVQWCMLSQGEKIKICFGLTKDFDTEARFTYLVLFRTGKKACKPTGGRGTGERNGGVTKSKWVCSLGESEFSLEYETKADPTTGKITYPKLVVGDLEVPDKGPKVVIVDLLAETPTYRLVNVELPACRIDLSDKDRKTWLKAIDDAIAELKEKSNEVKELAD
jgi:hypothetical protein